MQEVAIGTAFELFSLTCPINQLSLAFTDWEFFGHVRNGG